MNKELVSNANSKGVIIDYYGLNSKEFGRKAKFNLRDALKVIENDPIVKGAIISLCDKVLETPFQALGKDGKSKEKKAQQKLEELRTRELTRKVVFNLLLNGNAFIEIVKENGTVTDLNVLEAINTEIVAKDNGDVVKYVQELVGESGKKKGSIDFEPEKVVHIKLTDITTNIWGDVDIQAIYETVLLKESIRNWIYWFFKTNQARGFYNIKNASDAKVKDFLSILKQNERDKSKPVIAQGEVEYQLLRNFAEEGKGLEDMMIWANTEILALLNVPPIVMGMPDMSGRANSSEQKTSLYTRVNAIHQILEDAYTYELLPKIGFPKVMFSFGALDDSLMKTKMEIVTLMKNAGMTNEACTEYLTSEGVLFDTKEVFNEIPDPMDMGANATGQTESAPSRQRKGEGEANKQQDKPTTRKDQLVANAEPVLDQYAEVKKELKNGSS